MLTFSTLRIYCLATKNANERKKLVFNQKGTEDTEKKYVVSYAAGAGRNKENFVFYVSSVPLW